MSSLFNSPYKHNVCEATLVDLTLDASTYYLSTSYGEIQYLGNSYTQLGSLLSISDLQSDLRSTSADISISVSGVPADVDLMTLVLNTPILGGEVRIHRALFDPDSIALADVYTRYVGRVVNRTITENTNIIQGAYTNTITLTVGSYNSILDNSRSGQRTNASDRERYYPGDGSFDRVSELQNVDFDFGKPYQAGSQGYSGGYKSYNYLQDSD